jgi:hypothetical protein
MVIKNLRDQHACRVKLGGRRWPRISECESRALRPAVGVVIDAQDLQHVVVYSVGDDEGRFGDDEFARARHASRVTELRVLRQQLFDAVDDM